MYDDLIKRLKEDKSWVEQGTTETEHEIAKHIQQAADAIEQLTADLERLKDYEAFWKEEAEEALRRFQLAIADKPR